MYYIFEMANNHMGSVAHGTKIIDEFAGLAKAYDIQAAIKFQFRQLNTFIHKDADPELKFVKRFKETGLDWSEFRELSRHAKGKGVDTMATPFDEESLELLEYAEIDMIKIASCSVDDWPLLHEIAYYSELRKKRIIVSTAGAPMKTLDKVACLFRNFNLSFMHCVGEYPTAIEHANLQRITQIKERFPKLEVGISTHEDPQERSVIPMCVALGCTILEKHVYSDAPPNKYSCSVQHMDRLVNIVKNAESACYNGPNEDEAKTLRSLKRGMYFKKSVAEGKILVSGDVYYAMPVKDGQYTAADSDTLFGQVKDEKTLTWSPDDAPVTEEVISKNAKHIKESMKQINAVCENFGFAMCKGDREISAHYGIESFYKVKGKKKKTGAFIITKINIGFCKKYIIMLPNQVHPMHKHTIKEEAFDLVAGDCAVLKDGRVIGMVGGGDLIHIPQGTMHGFEAGPHGCIFEEVSTQHHKGDSTYADSSINDTDINERKFIV